MWFEDEPDVSLEDKEDIGYIETWRRNPAQRYIYMSQSGRSAAIAFTDGRVFDFGHYGGEFSGGAAVSFDGRLVCRASAPLEAYQEDTYPPYSVLHASLDGGPLQLITNDYTQYMVLEHKNQILYIQNTPGSSGLFSWVEGRETLVFADAIQFVCSANGAYAVLEGKDAIYCVEVESKTAIEVSGEALAFDDARPIAVSNDGGYIYFEYGDGNEERTIACTQLDKKTGRIEVVGEAIGNKNAEIVFNYAGTQAVIEMDGHYWAFSPNQGLRQTNNIPLGTFWRHYYTYTNQNALTFLNPYTFRDDHPLQSDLLNYCVDVYACAVANFDDVFAAMIQPPSNLGRSNYLYYNRTEDCGIFYSSDVLYEFEIVDGVAGRGRVLADDIVDFQVSVDNTKLYYLKDTSGMAFSHDGVSTAQLWFKEGGREPVLIEEEVCYYAYDTDRNTFYGMYIAISPDGSKVTYVADFDLPSKLGTLMMAENGGQPEIVSGSATEPLRVDNDGNVLLTRHFRYEDAEDWSPFFNYFDLYLLAGGKETLLDKDIALAWYT